MEKSNKNMEEFNNIELMKVIYKEIMQMKLSINNKTEEKIDKLSDKIDEINNRLENRMDKLSNKIDRNSERIDELSEKIDKSNERIDELSEKTDNTNCKLDKLENDVKEIKIILEEHSEKLEKHDKKFESLENKTDKILISLEDLSRTEKLHFEYTSNKFNRLEQKIDSNFRYLDEKIENTKNKLVSETSDILESFSIAATKSIKNIENKVENERKERTLEIDKIKGMSDYNKIILRNLESRICILEEESEKYNNN